MARGYKCPTCGKVVAPRGVNPLFPFCSDRCRLRDLGRWIDEGYRIPGARVSDAELANESQEDEES